MEEFAGFGIVKRPHEEEMTQQICNCFNISDFIAEATLVLIIMQKLSLKQFLGMVSFLLLLLLLGHLGLELLMASSTIDSLVG